MALDAGKVVATLAMELDDAGFRTGEAQMRRWQGSKATAQLKFDIDEGPLRRAERGASEFGRKRETAHLRYDVDRSGLDRALGGVRDFDNSVSDAAQSSRDLGEVFGVLKFAPLAIGALNAATAIESLGGGVISLGGALSSLSGLLVTIPQGLLGFAQAFGTVGIATSGVKDAITAYEEQQKAAAITDKRAAGQATSAAEARKSAAQTVIGAQQGVHDSEQALADTHRQVTYAQQALNQAEFEAVRQMQDLRRASIESSTAEKQAALDLRQARAALRQGLRDPSTSALDIEQLQLSVTEARQGLTDVRTQGRRARQDYSRAIRQGGAEGLPAVVQARRALADAERSEQRAAEGLSRANAQLAYSQEQANLHVQQAAQGLSTSAAAADKYQQALQNLAPAQRRFVEFITSLSDKFERLKASVSAGFLPGLQRGIKGAMQNFPVLRRVLNETGRALGGVAERFGKYLGRAGVGRDLERFAHTNIGLFRDLGRVGEHFANALRIIMRDAQPLVKWLGRISVHVSALFENWIRHVHRSGQLSGFFKETARTLHQIGRLTQNLGSIFINVARAVAPVGNSILGWLNKVTKQWADWTGSLEGQVGLRVFFERLRKPMENLLNLAAKLGGLLLQVFGSEAATKMMDELVGALVRALPALKRLGDALVEIAAIVGPSLVDALASIVVVFADGAPAMAAAARLIAKIAQAFTWLLQNVPFLSSATGVIAEFGFVLMGVKWAYAASGIKDLAGAMRGLFGKGGLIEKSPRLVSTFMDNLVAFPSNLRSRARRLVGALKETFVRIGSRLGLITGEQVAADTVGGQAAGQAGAGIIGGIKGKLGRLRSRLGSMFRALGLALGIRMGEEAAAGAVGGEAAGAAGAGLLGKFRARIPRLRTVFRGFGTTLAAAFVSGFLLYEGWNVAMKLGKKLGIDKPSSVTGGGSVVFPHGPPSGGGALWRGSPFSLPNPHIHIPFGQHGGLVTEQGILGFQGGGQVPGATDTVPAMLTPGEVVLPRGVRKAVAMLMKVIRGDVTGGYEGILHDVTDRQKKLGERTKKNFRQQHDDAVKSTDDLHDAAKAKWTDLADFHDRTTGKMRDRTQQRFGAMADAANTQGDNLVKFVERAMGNADDATFKGMNYIVTATDKALKAFNAKASVHLHLDRPQGHAEGGMIGGSGRQDTVPLLLGMAAPGEAILTRYQQRWVEAALRNTFGMGLGDLFATERRPHGYAQGGKLPGGGSPYRFPFSNYQWGRTDMGVDFTGSGAIGAIGAGTIAAVNNMGWPSGGAGPSGRNVVLNLAAGAPKGYSPETSQVYYAEGLTPRVHPGQRVKAGETIASFFPGSSIEVGWYSGGNALASSHYSEGDVTAEGSSFRRFLSALAHGKGPLGGAGAVAHIARLILRGPDSPLKSIVQAALDKGRGAANTFIDHMAARFAAPGLGLSGLGAIAHGSIAKQFAQAVHRTGAGPVPSLALFEAGLAESGMGATSNNVLQLTGQKAGGVGPGSSALDQALVFLLRGYGGGSLGAIGQHAADPREPAYAIAQDEQVSGAGAATHGASNYGVQRSAAIALMRGQGLSTKGLAGFQQGGLIAGGLRRRIHGLTHIPEIRHLEEIAARITNRIRHYHGGAHGAEAMRHRLSGVTGRIHRLQADAKKHHDQIRRLQGRFAARLMGAYGHFAHRVDLGLPIRPGAVRSLHVGPGLGSGFLSDAARSYQGQLRASLAVSRSQAPILRSFGGFAGGGTLGGGMAVVGAPGGPAVYLVIDDPVLSALDPRIREVSQDEFVRRGHGAYLRTRQGGGSKSYLQRRG